MEKFGKSQPVRRIEDHRFLTGHGRYVDDIAPSEAKHAFFFRSPVAHAHITDLDVQEAQAAEGVHLVVTIDDLIAAGVDTDLKGELAVNRDGSHGTQVVRPLLAQNTVRHVGEAIVMIVADTLDQARDAAELMTFDYDDLDVNLALDADGPLVHQALANNQAFDFGLGREEETQSAFETAAHVVSLEVENNRIHTNSMEPRGCFAEWENDRLHVSFSGQGVWQLKRRLISMLRLDESQVRVTNPDVGGGFGMKAMTYPEYYLIAYAAMQLGQPVRWVSERTEAMLSDNGGRDLTTFAEMAFDKDYRITGYRVTTKSNLGAYNSQFGQLIQTNLFSKVLTGPYDIQAAYQRVYGYYTNTQPVDAYRGAGRPEAIYVIERILDRAARDLGVDPWEIRRRNFIRPDQFPYKTVAGDFYDVGDFHSVLDHALRASDAGNFEKRRAGSRSAGKLRGLGICYYIESILGDPSETAKIVFTEDGRAEIFVGTQSNGQGHETVYAVFLSDQTGIPLDKITVIQGDSDLIKTGGGTGGSRSVTVQNAATLATVDRIVAGFTAYLSEKSGVDAGDIVFDHETFRVGQTNLTPTLLEVAEMARQDGRQDLLAVQERITLEQRSFPNGAHVAEVEIDPETGRVSVERYTIVDDFGNLINPLLVEGQVHGGVAQGLGQAISEQVVFDETGQLLSATFMDYAMPRAKDMPLMTFETQPVPTTTNIMGMKGCGEAGTVGSKAAIANAVQDALWERGVSKVDMPFTPFRVWHMLDAAQQLKD